MSMFFYRKKVTSGVGEKDKGSPRTPRAPDFKYLEIFPQVPKLSPLHTLTQIIAW